MRRDDFEYQSTNSYGSNIPQTSRTQSKKVIRGVNNGRFSGKAYKDEKKGNIKGLLKTTAVILAGLSIAAGVHVGKNIAEDQRVYESNLDKIVESIGDDYYDSLYLMENVAFEDYVEAVEAELKNTISNEPHMKDYIIDNTSNWGELGYLLVGEGNRDDITNENLFSTMVDYNSYVSDKANGKGTEEATFITQICDLADKCTSDANKEYVVRIVDATQGAKSISNGKAALEYRIDLNEEHRQGIVRTDNIEGLEERIYTNSDFFNLLVNEKDELAQNNRARTIVNFYNARVETAQDICESENMPEMYKNVFGKYENVSKWNSTPRIFDVPEIGTIKETMNETEIATYDAFNVYASGRNEFYKEILEEKSNPEEAVNRLNKEDEVLKARIQDQENVASKDMGEFLQGIEEVFELQRKLEDLKEHTSATPSHGVGRCTEGPEL